MASRLAQVAAEATARPGLFGGRARAFYLEVSCLHACSTFVVGRLYLKMVFCVM
jgi:hypothetical protein